MSENTIHSIVLEGTVFQIEDTTVPAWARTKSKPEYTAEELNAVPNTRTINNKPLSEDITLTAEDVNALSAMDLENYVKRGDLEDYVPASRKINGQRLINDITLTAEDVNALSASVLEGYVPNTRTINRKPLSEDITLTADDLRINVADILPSDNITGTGEAGCIAKFTGKNTIESGPTFGTSTTTFLRNDGRWAAAYSHPTTAGNKHIPTGGSEGQYLKYTANGTAVWARALTYSKTALTSARNAQNIVCVETINVPAYSWCHVRVAVAAASQSMSNVAPIELTLYNGRTIYDIVPSILIPGISSSPGYAETWYYNNTDAAVLVNVSINSPTDITLKLLSTYTSATGNESSPASYYEIIT